MDSTLDGRLDQSIYLNIERNEEEAKAVLYPRGILTASDYFLTLESASPYSAMVTALNIMFRMEVLQSGHFGKASIMGIANSVARSDKPKLAAGQAWALR